jgi:hypothetical protein
VGRPDLRPLIQELHGDALAGLDRALGRGTAILLARVGDGEQELIAQYPHPILAIDATLYPDRWALRFELLREVAVGLLGADPASVLSDLGPDGDAARLALATAYGERASRVMALLRQDTPPAQGNVRISVADALAGAEPEVPLVVFDAHRLETDARWDLRELERPLLVVTRPDHHAQLTADDAPFYGHAQTLTLRAPGPNEWMRALNTVGIRMHPADLEWLLARTRGRVATTVQTLELLAPNRSPRTAWRLAVRGSLSRAHDTLALARSVHAYGPTLLLAIAQEHKPYTAVPNAPPARVALALRKLRSVDIIEQPEPRAWRIADPLLEYALRSVINSTRMRLASAELFDGDWAMEDQ